MRLAILEANALGGADTIVFAAGVDAGSINLLSALPTLTELAAFDASALTTGITITGNDFGLGANLSNVTSGNITFGGTLSGTGSLSVSTTGVITLSGANTYTGTTSITAGTLRLASGASTTSNTTLSAGTLSGFGTIGGNLTHNDGIVAPGSSGTPGTLSVTGNYSHVGVGSSGPAGSMRFEVTPATASKLAVTGTATLTGPVALVFNPGAYTAKTYTILTAGSISGTFSSVSTTGSPGLTIGNLQYNPTSVTFDLIGGTASGTGIFSDIAFPEIDAAHQAGDTIFDHLNDANNGVETQTTNLAFSSVGASATQLGEENTKDLSLLAKSFSTSIKQFGGWFKGTGNLASVDSTATKSGYNSETGGFMFGLDTAVEKGLRVGAAGGYEHTNLTAKDVANTTGESNTIRFGLYGSKALPDNFSLDGRVAYALHMIDTNRFETGNSLIAHSSHDGHEVSTGVQLNKAMRFKEYAIKPKAGLSFTHLSEDGYTESGAGVFNATVSGKETNSLRLYTGLSVSRPVTVGSWNITPEARTKYAYEAMDAISSTSGTVLGTAFSSNGVRPSRSMLSVGFGASAKLNDTFDGFGSYDANLPTGNTFEQTFALGVKVKF